MKKFSDFINEAKKMESEINQSLADVFTKAFKDKKIAFKEDGNTLVLTIKETEPNSSRDKFNEYDLETVIKEMGGDMKMGSRSQDGKEVFSSGDIQNIDGKKRLAWSFKSTSKFRTSAIKIF